MQPQQPQTPSEPESPPDATEAEAPSEQTEGSERRAPSWWDRLLGRGTEREPASDDAEEATAAKATSPAITLTQEELDRRVQAETDRREFKRQKEQHTASRRKLRDEDPWAYAEQERQAEEQANQNGQLEQIFSSLGAEHDRVTLDPLTQALPKAEYSRILGLEGAGVGLEGRKLIVSETLKALEKHWKAEGARDAEAKLRKNSAFRKQIYGEFRGGEPEVLPSGNGSGRAVSSDDVNNMLRRQIGLNTSE